MKDELSQIDLGPTLREWPVGHKENRDALGDGWAIAEEFLRLHTRGLQHISRAAGAKPSESDKAMILLGTHGLNLYITALGLIVGGLFDVASHLARGLLDCQSLLYATARDEALGAKFMAGPERLKASEGRKVMINDLRNAGEDQLANDIETRYQEEAKAANSLAHVSVVHADKLVKMSANSLTPVAGGLAAGEEARRLWLVALEQELWMLGWLRAFRSSSLDSDWIAQYEATKSRFHEWFRKEAQELQIDKVQKGQRV
jgi:hypothetical protein